MRIALTLSGLLAWRQTVRTQNQIIDILLSKHPEDAPTVAELLDYSVKVHNEAVMHCLDTEGALH